MNKALLKIKAVPGSSRTEISGWLDDRLKVRVAAPPEKGKANAAIEKLLGALLAVPVCVVKGQSNPLKVVEIEGLSEEIVLQKINARIHGGGNS